MKGITTEAFKVQCRQDEGLKGVLALSDSTLIKPNTQEEDSRLKFITHADHSSLKNLDHKPLLTKLSSNGKNDRVWLKNLLGKDQKYLLNNIHIGGFRAKIKDKYVTENSVKVKIDKSHGLGPMRKDPADNADARTWNDGMDSAADKIVQALKDNFGDKKFVFVPKKNADMDDFVALLNNRANPEAHKIDTTATIARPEAHIVDSHIHHITSQLENLNEK
tara:strand:+ start:26789 stop:27448 length:660 start_codon:yes stop_codon:yes gene_type:complete